LRKAYLHQRLYLSLGSIGLVVSQILIKLVSSKPANHQVASIYKICHDLCYEATVMPLCTVNTELKARKSDNQWQAVIISHRRQILTNQHSLQTSETEVRPG